MARARCRIELIRVQDLQPVDQHWHPAVELWELVDANERLERAGLPMRWRVCGEVMPIAPTAPRVAASYEA